MDVMLIEFIERNKRNACMYCENKVKVKGECEAADKDHNAHNL
jgi:hypothetical protein